MPMTSFCNKKVPLYINAGVITKKVAKFSPCKEEWDYVNVDSTLVNRIRMIPTKGQAELKKGGVKNAMEKGNRVFPCQLCS